MTETPARDRQKLLKKAFREAERRAELESSPLPLSELRELLEGVTRLVFDERGCRLCDRMYRFTRFSLQARGCDNVEQVISFLMSRGFHCDCQVALNLGSWLDRNTPRGQTLHS